MSKKGTKVAALAARRQELASYDIPSRRRDMDRSKNPTRGVLIPLAELCQAGTKAMRATLAGRYAS